MGSKVALPKEVVPHARPTPEVGKVERHNVADELNDIIPRHMIATSVRSVV